MSLPGDEAFRRNHGRLLALLRERAYERREVILTSGRRSNFYIDCKQVALSAEGHFLVGWLFGALLAAQAPEVEAVGGMTLGADPLASAVSTLSFLGSRPLPAFYVRKEPKAHGTAQWIEGTKNLRADMPVALLEDVITTGGSTLRALERVEQAGLRVVRVLALVDRQEGGREAVEARVPLTALYAQQDFC